MKDSVKVELIWEPGAYDKLTHDTPDKIMYEIADTTLNLTFPIMPEKTGEMKRSSLAKGVQGSNLHYKIGSYTDYASCVYVMPEKTNWTTPGTTAYWFRNTWQKYGNNIIQESCERNSLK
jgi:hypothetical protein